MASLGILLFIGLLIAGSRMLGGKKPFRKRLDNLLADCVSKAIISTEQHSNIMGELASRRSGYNLNRPLGSLYLLGSL